MKHWSYFKCWYCLLSLTIHLPLHALIITPQHTLHALHQWRKAAAASKPSYGTCVSVDESVAEMKITAYLQSWIGTKSRIKDLLHSGQIRVNQRNVFSNYILKSGDKVEFLLQDSHNVDIQIPEKQIERLTTFTNVLLKSDLNPCLTVLYEDDHLAVVLKPSGVHSLSWIGTMKKNLFALDDVLPVLLQTPNENSMYYNDSLSRPLPCHRLDARVPGCLLVGKTVSTLSHLNNQFQDRSIIKEYTAIVCGNATNALRGPSSLVSFDVNGYSAESLVEVQEVVGCNVYGAMSRLRLCPHTGRRHQLRQHCAWIGCPIIGDDVYHNCASYPAELKAEAIHRAERGEAVEMFSLSASLFPFVRERGGLYLMSTGIEFTHPVTSERMRIGCQSPRKFENILLKAKKGAEWAAAAQHLGSNSDGFNES